MSHFSRVGLGITEFKKTADAAFIAENGTWEVGGVQ
jgi:hypothetical protein